MLEKYETHHQTFSLTILPVLAWVPEITVRQIQCLGSTFFLLLAQDTYRSDKLSDRTDAQTSPSSAQELQKAIQSDAILPGRIELGFLAAAGVSVSATLGQQAQHKCLIKPDFPLEQIPQFKKWAFPSDSGK